MESMVRFAEISGVQPKLPSVQVCNTTKCAPQVCNVVDMVCTHLANQNLGRAIGKILHFSSLAFKLLPVCQCDHFCCITALFYLFLVFANIHQIMARLVFCLAQRVAEEHAQLSSQEGRNGTVALYI